METLCEAVLAQDSRLVSELLLSSPSLATTAVDEDGTSPLHLAANSHSTAILELLVKHGAWVNSQNDDGFTPLHVAALWGKAEAVQLLLARGADPAITDCDELSPLDHAQNEGHAECVDLLQDGLPPHSYEPYDPELSICETFVSMMLSDPLHDDDITMRSPNTTPQRGSTNSDLAVRLDLEGSFDDSSSTNLEHSELYTTALDVLDLSPCSHTAAQQLTPTTTRTANHATPSPLPETGKTVNTFEFEKTCDDFHTETSTQLLDATFTFITTRTTATSPTPSLNETTTDLDTSSSLTPPPPPPLVPQSLLRLTNSELRQRLLTLGEQPGPVTASTRPAYLSYLARIESGVRLSSSDAGNQAGCGGSKDYRYELALVLSGVAPVPNFSSLEKKVFQSFRQAPSTPSQLHTVTPSTGHTRTSTHTPSHIRHSTFTPSRHHHSPLTPSQPSPKSAAQRKTHFNYLLLNPLKISQLLQQLDEESDRPHLSELEQLTCFVEGVFYIGKGTNARSMQHLKDARDWHKNSSAKLSAKLQCVLEIWAAGRGVVSLQLFNNITAEEAFTREACMIDAIGLQVLTNVQRGRVYGEVGAWSASRRRHFGVHLLSKALQSFLLDPPQEIFQTDL